MPVQIGGGVQRAGRRGGGIDCSDARSPHSRRCHHRATLRIYNHSAVPGFFELGRRLREAVSTTLPAPSSRCMMFV